MAKTKRKSNVAKHKPKRFKWVVIFILVAGAAVAYYSYQQLYKPNVHIEQQEGKDYLYIRTGSTFEQVLAELDENHYLTNEQSFRWMAEKMNYTKHVKPGRYLIVDGMSNRELISMLRSGKQASVKVIFHNIRLMKDMVEVISDQIEADSSVLLKLLNDNKYLEKYGFTKETVPALFIPNTYEMYWNTSAEEFIERMYKEYKKFWNQQRTNKAESIGLKKIEVSILASIVEEETQRNDERPTIAGVYKNRLDKDMLLQADPTVKFAVGDFSIKRILNKHTEIDSPYNTYKYKGLPPGPICVPSISAINAVLNYQHHDYLYFCAKEDFSGRHNFARTIEQHNRNAKLYQRALGRNGIWK
jgi:UPF0755 protein